LASAASLAKIATISQNSLFSAEEGVGYTEEWLETERARVVDPTGFCSLASLAFPPTGPPGRSFGNDPERLRGRDTPAFGRFVVGKKLYVGNLTYRVSSSDLEQLFSQYGSVQSAEVISDRDTGRSKGFGFVEMSSDSEARAAIEALNDHEHEGRRLTVNEARPREPRPGGGGGGGGGWRGGGGGGGGGRGSRGGGYDSRRY
jgi:cold-inducible RNA-binding protein